MKMNVLRHLLLPWAIFFLIGTAALVFVGIKLHIPARDHHWFRSIVGVGVFICLYSNVWTLNRAGIWMAYGLPSQLQYTFMPWFKRAAIALAVAYATYIVGQFAWMPLFWQAFVQPVIFAGCLFVIVRHLVGPLLKIGSNIAFGKTFATLFTLPIYLLVPATAVFVGEGIVNSYRMSLAEGAPPMRVPVAADKKAIPVAETTETAPENEPPRVQELRGWAEGHVSCEDGGKAIRTALDPKAPEDVAYWGVKALKCTETKAVVALPKLITLMQDHKSPKVRAAAITAMSRYGNENVKRVAYLVLKRISEKEQPEVIEAAAKLMGPAGEEERMFAIKRLKNLLDVTATAPTAAKILMHTMNREDAVAEYVGEHLGESGEARERAAGMLCSLSKDSKVAAEPHIDNVVASIKTGEKNDPALAALNCMGSVGFEALRREVLTPKALTPVVSARALANFDVKDKPDALATIETCARNPNGEVRKYCSESLGNFGAKALPKIIDMLQSGERDLYEAGTTALNTFDDPAAKNELRKIRADNSGWMANKRKLKIAEAVDTALNKIESEEQQKNLEGNATQAN